MELPSGSIRRSNDHRPRHTWFAGPTTARHWGRWLQRRGFEVIFLPPHYVRPYLRRNMTDRTDCEALLEALRCAGIHPVSLKSEDQHAPSTAGIEGEWRDGTGSQIKGGHVAVDYRPLQAAGGCPQGSSGDEAGPRSAANHRTTHGDFHPFDRSYTRRQRFSR
jgi:hypothetical protein